MPTNKGARRNRWAVPTLPNCPNDDQGLIQYEAYIDGKWRAIVRFDEVPGFFHRDVMSPTGEQEKFDEAASDKKLALTQAIADIKQFWHSYRKAYEDKYYGNK